ncbi:indolepyruvate oxidoreductase subunit beta [Patescibacteria group bacterium]
MKNNKIKEFNIVIAGTGGQGLITLLKVIAQAAALESYDLKTSELHGLSQRGGSVEVHIRFGKKIYSPLIKPGGADLIISLEAQEALRSCDYCGPQTNFLINKHFIPILSQKAISEREIIRVLGKCSKSTILVPASQICKKKLGATVLAGTYLLSLAVFKGLIPLKQESIRLALKKIIPEKYLEMNIEAFDLAQQSFLKEKLGRPN